MAFIIYVHDLSTNVLVISITYSGSKESFVGGSRSVRPRNRRPLADPELGFFFQAPVRFYTLNRARGSTNEGRPEFAGWRREPVSKHSVERSTGFGAEPGDRLKGSFC